MASSSSQSTSNRDLSLIPDLTFAFVEDFIKNNANNSGKEQMNKGFKYYSEGYIHSVCVYQDECGSLVTARCYRSQRKGLSPHDVKVLFNKDKVEHSTCSCTIGLSESCGHIIGLLYQLAHYKTMKYTLIPADVAKTSLPQTWHIPRGEKLHGDKVENITVQSYDRTLKGQPKESNQHFTIQ